MEPISVMLLGLLIGLSVGLTTTGAGHILTPALILLGKVEPGTAVAVSLVQGAVMKFAGFLQHTRQRTVLFPVSFDFLILGLPLAYLGGIFSARIDKSMLEGTVGVVLIGLSFVLLGETWLHGKPRHCHDRYRDYVSEASAKKRAAIILTGGIIGFITGLTSIGSGSLIIFSLLLILRMPALLAVGTCIFTGLVMTLAATAAHASLGGIDYALANLLLAGSVPGVFIGTILVSRLHPKTVKSILAIKTLVFMVVFLAGIALLL